MQQNEVARSWTQTSQPGFHHTNHNAPVSLNLTRYLYVLQVQKFDNTAFTWSIMSVTIHAVMKSPIHVPNPAAFMKVSFCSPRYEVILYKDSLSPSMLRNPL